MTRKLFTYLKKGGADVYMPAKKTGKCTSPYVVINEEKREPSPSGKSDYVYFTIEIIAPLENYSSLDKLTSTVKTALNGTPFKFIESHSGEPEGNTNSYKRIMTYRAIKPICSKI